MKRILICCSGGITSKILVKRLNALQEYEQEYFFESVSEAFLFPAKEGIDFILFAPQLVLDEKRRADILREYHCASGQIPGDIYSGMDEREILLFMEELFVRNEKPVQLENRRLPESILLHLERFAHSRTIQRILKCTAMLGGLVIGQSAFGLILSLPLGSWYDGFLMSSGLEALLSIPVETVSNMVALLLAFLLGSQFYDVDESERLFMGLLSVCAFILLLPVQITYGTVEYVPRTIRIPLECLSSSGVLIAIVTAVFAGGLYLCVTGPLFRRCLPVMMIRVAGTFSVLTGMMMIRVILQGFGTNAFELCRMIINAILPFISDSYAGYAVFVFFSCLLYVLGIHGPMTMYAMIVPLHTMMTYCNLNAFIQGVPAPYPAWQLTPFVFLGGCGATLALEFLMLVKARSRALGSLGKLSLPMVVFNINEPLIFGAPVVFNPLLGIPFVLAPMANLGICYLSMELFPLVPPPTGDEISVYYPIGIASLLTCGSLRALFLCLFLLLMDCAIYYPFFKRYDLIKWEEECKNPDGQSAIL